MHLFCFHAPVIVMLHSQTLNRETWTLICDRKVVILTIWSMNLCFDLLPAARVCDNMHVLGIS